MSLKILNNVNLSQYTSWLVGGEAEYFCLPENRDQLIEALQFLKKNPMPVTILSGGTNVLVSDKGIKGLTLCLRRFSHIESKTENNRLYIECLSGTAKSELLKVFLKNKLAPALFLAGLPGDVGGGITMNAGVSEKMIPREFMEFVDEVEVMNFDGVSRWMKREDFKISYRHTEGWQPDIIVSCKISWPLEIDPDMIIKVREANKVRLTKQPLDMPSCGSVFKNPLPQSSGKLIQDCGLKGFQIGGAQVSLKHANFIVNLGEATAQNIWDVITHVKSTVKAQTGVDLHTEVIRLGEWS